MENGPFYLIVNSGSSSLKMTLFSSSDWLLWINLQIKALASDQPIVEINRKGVLDSIQLTKKMTMGEAFSYAFSHIFGDIALLSIAAIGHRFVHGGKNFVTTTRIDPRIFEELEKLVPLAPLHQQACLDGVKSAWNYCGEDIPQIAVFDTAFHHGLPKVAARYALPQEESERYGIQRYGFHGISHGFLWERYVAEFPQEREAKILSLHLGNGCSITAIRGGQSMDTSMGFTPAEGLMMATRAGDLDVAIIEFLCRQEKWEIAEVMELLNQRSGLLGVSGLSADMKVLLAKCDEVEAAKIAVELFCYRILKYIGSYFVVLGGVDAILFTGGIGEHAPEIRRRVIEGLSCFGAYLDEVENQKSVNLPPGEMRRIHSDSSTFGLYVIATDENRAICREVAAYLAIE